MSDEGLVWATGGTSDGVRTAEMVSDGHPDKFCDQVADAILDAALESDPQSRVAIECLAKDNLLFVSGELTTKTDLDRPSVGGIEGIARRVWAEIGYGDPGSLAVVNHVKRQSPEIAQGVDTGGAGDQGVMVGYATSETEEYLPLEYVLARDLNRRIRQLRLEDELGWLRPDVKTQVSVCGRRVTSVVVAAQHDESVLDAANQSLSGEAVEALWGKAIVPVLGAFLGRERPRLVINGTGSFTVGGPRGDAGVVGRKIVVDAYGPRVRVGGGAYSGKDATKVDRSAAYMARHIAKTIVARRIAGAEECCVELAYAIGQLQPEAVVARAPGGRDLTSWVHEAFPDLSPRWIIDYLGLRRPAGWTYRQTAAFGHYGRAGFPWERVADRG